MPKLLGFARQAPVPPRRRRGRAKPWLKEVAGDPSTQKIISDMKDTNPALSCSESACQHGIRAGGLLRREGVGQGLINELCQSEDVAHMSFIGTIRPVAGSF